jgi:hypothetical protein
VTSHPEEELAGALAAYVEEVRTDRDMYAAVLRWHRRRRRAQLGGSLAVAAAVVAVVAVIAAGQPLASDPKPAPATPPPTYVHPNGVRGSLGGDQQLLDQARSAVLSKKDHGDPWPDEITPLYAERTGNATIVLFLGTSRANPKLGMGLTATQVGNQRTWTVVPNAGAQDRGDPMEDARFQQRYYGDPFWTPTQQIGDHDYLAIVVPPRTRAEIADGLTIAADGTPVRTYVPLELHAGTAFLDLGGRGPLAIRYSDGGRVVSQWIYRASTAGIYTVDRTLRPTDAELAAAAAHARGHVDQRALSLAGTAVAADVAMYDGLRMRFRVSWGGTILGEPCVIAGMQFDSGATYAILICAAARGGGTEATLGTVQAGAFDQVSMAWSDLGGKAPYRIMARPGVVRAEVVYADQVVPVPLDNGFGLVTRPGKATVVRLYDAAGHRVEEVPIDRGVHLSP